MLHVGTAYPSGEARRLWRVDLSSLKADLAFAAAVSAVLNLVFLVVVGIQNWMLYPAWALNIERFLLGFVLVRTIPSVAIVAIVANRAPAAGWPRYACLVAGGILCMVWWSIVGKMMAPNIAGPGGIDFTLATLQIVASSYRSSARTADGELLRRHVDAMTLKAEVKRTNLGLLRAQMEPHFLFNTLATVRALSRVNVEATLDMIDNLTRYLSEALPQLRQEETTLENERELICAYLRIHQIRSGPRLEFEFDLPAELRSARVPTLILLTLVENALKHGVDPVVAGGHIRVSAAREHTMLILRVADSGTGMSATEGHGLGLANIRRRLNLLYGNRAQLTLTSQKPGGVTAIVALPAGRQI